MNRNPITHDNHYVPQFYLKNWSEDGKNLNVYNILVSNGNVPLWSKKAIKHQAYYRDFYTRDVDGDEKDDIEQWFSNEFESPVKEVIEKVKTNSRLRKMDWQHLIKFMAAQQLRTPAKLNELLARWRTEMPSLFQGELEKIIEKMEKPGFIPPQINSNLDTNLFPIKVKLEEKSGVITVNSIVGKSMYLFGLKYVLKNTIHILNNHQWHIVHAPDEIEWPTSDDPVICLNFYNENNYNFEGGWGKKNGEIIFPLTPKHILYTQIGNSNRRCQLDNSHKYGLLLQKFIIEHAHRYIYAYKPLKEMQKLRSRKVDPEIYKREREAFKIWHTEQTKYEKEILE
ncbi:DUF4238 domain-containing protein [Paenibacillus senegalimassiliensis]|uniref:DUF4238 domain-containing protein n=1 Tax=Paenibacillus senegalimassiliensis TaxID=1737426 RepID=UPI00073E93F2|nr:DUF4238 domain-containing protein [Paenibacillus senegalimassiliensis]